MWFCTWNGTDILVFDARHDCWIIKKIDKAFSHFRDNLLTKPIKTYNKILSNIHYQIKLYKLGRLGLRVIAVKRRCRKELISSGTRYHKQMTNEFKRHNYYYTTFIVTLYFMYKKWHHRCSERRLEVGCKHRHAANDLDYAIFLICTYWRH